MPDAMWYLCGMILIMEVEMKHLFVSFLLVTFSFSLAPASSPGKTLTVCYADMAFKKGSPKLMSSLIKDGRNSLHAERPCIQEIIYVLDAGATPELVAQQLREIARIYSGLNIGQVLRHYSRDYDNHSEAIRTLYGIELDTVNFWRGFFKVEDEPDLDWQELEAVLNRLSHSE